MMKTRLLIADDHTIIRKGLARIIADTDDLIVVGEACDGNEALALVRDDELNLDLVVLDLSMPGRNGVDLIKLIKAERPKLPILIFSMHAEEQFAVRAIRAGATGYLTKECDSDLILPAIRKAAAGGIFVSQKVTELLISDFSRNADAPPHNLLSDREFEVFSRLVRGASLSHIANEFSLSVKTVSTHKTHVLNKMKLSSEADLVRYAIEHNLLNLDRE